MGVFSCLKTFRHALINVMVLSNELTYVQSGRIYFQDCQSCNMEHHVASLRIKIESEFNWVSGSDPDMNWESG